MRTHVRAYKRTCAWYDLSRISCITSYEQKKEDAAENSIAKETKANSIFTWVTYRNIWRHWNRTRWRLEILSRMISNIGSHDITRPSAISGILTSDSIRWAWLKPVSVPSFRILEPSWGCCSSTRSSTTRCNCRSYSRSNRAAPDTVYSPPVCRTLTCSPVRYPCSVEPTFLSSSFPTVAAEAPSSPRLDSCWPKQKKESRLKRALKQFHEGPFVRLLLLTNISSNLSLTVSSSILSIIHRCCSISLKSSPEWGRGIVWFPEPLLTPPPRPDFLGRPNHVSSWNTIDPVTIKSLRSTRSQHLL